MIRSAAIAALALLGGGALAGTAHAAVAPCDPLLAERGQFKIDHPVRSGSRVKLTVAFNKDGVFRESDLQAFAAQAQQELYEQAAREEPPRFVWIAVSSRCLSMDEASKTVVVEVHVDRVVIPEGNTAGEIVDEASRFRLAGTQRYPRVGLRVDGDERLGTVFGAEIQNRFPWAPPDPGTNESPFKRSSLFGTYTLDAWKACAQCLWKTDGDWYHLSFDAAAQAVAGDPRGMHVGSQQRYWTERVPFANGSLKSTGLAIGGSYEWQVGRADLRATVGFRFESVSVEAPTAVIPSRKELAAETTFQQEFTTTRGFLRWGGWLDHADYTRGGVFARLYDDYSIGTHGSWLVDATFSAGVEGLVPVHRMFTGGNRLDPFLADRIAPASQFTWAGPTMRSYGVSGFALPIDATTIDGMHYAGVSLTIGLPGFSESLVSYADRSQKAEMTRRFEETFDDAVEQIMARQLRRGMSPDEAKNRTTKEGQQLQRVLGNVLSHGRRLTIRPLVAADLAELGGPSTIRAMSIGGGVRITGLTAGAELLLMDNVKPNTTETVASGRQVLVRAYFRSGVRR